MAPWQIVVLFVVALAVLVGVARALRHKGTHRAPRKPLDATPPGWGSMALGDEIALHHAGWAPSGPDWRQQTMTELSPEALELPERHRELIAGAEAFLASLPPAGPLSPASLAPVYERLADTDDIAEARGWPTKRDQDAEVAAWCAQFPARWGVAA